MKPRKFIEIMKVAEGLKNNTRHSWTSKGRQESVAEHSWRLSIMAYFMKDEFPDINIDKVITMCIFHDIGESFTGDIPTFYKGKEDEMNETNILMQWFESLPNPYNQELKVLFAEMEAQETVEAKLYKALDKLEVLIQHNEADISTWIPLEKTLNLHHGDKEVSFSDYLKLLREEIYRDTKQKIENELKNEEGNLEYLKDNKLQ